MVRVYYFFRVGETVMNCVLSSLECDSHDGAVFVECCRTNFLTILGDERAVELLVGLAITARCHSRAGSSESTSSGPAIVRFNPPGRSNRRANVVSNDARHTQW
jgi:hypothetical protein